MTLTLHLHFLTGRYAATAYNDRSSAEWPPHPARLFSALVDALHHDEPIDPAEAEALDALAAQPAPIVVASEASTRRVMTSFVPVNDTALTDVATLASREAKYRAARAALEALGPDAADRERQKVQKALDKASDTLEKEARKQALPGRAMGVSWGMRVLPWGRTKQPRTFPVAIPTKQSASMIWQTAELPDGQARALDSVARRVVRLGHSSSFVSVRVEVGDTEWLPPSDPDSAVWTPSEDGEDVLRVPLPSQRAALDAQYARHGGDMPGRVMPARHVRYERVEARARTGRTRRTSGRWIAYELTGKALPPSRAAVAIADGVRTALLHHADTPAHPMLCGLDQGQPLASPHLAFVPLPFVGRHGDGAVRGFALSLPRGASSEAVTALLAALGRWEKAGDPDARQVELDIGAMACRARRIVDPATALHTLRRSRWTGRSRRWATVTPIALDGECSPLNHSKDSVRRKAHRTAAKLVRRAICRVVEPPDGESLAPADIALSLVFDAPIEGGAHLRSVPPFQRPGHPRPRRLVHAVFELPFAIRGPLLLGSGRHFGLGLCAPLPATGDER